MSERDNNAKKKKLLLRRKRDFAMKRSSISTRAALTVALLGSLGSAASIAAAPVGASSPPREQRARSIPRPRSFTAAASRSTAPSSTPTRSSRFEAAYRISQAPRLLYNLATTHRKLGHLQDAIDFFDEVPQAPARHRADRRSTVEGYLAELRAQLQAQTTTPRVTASPQPLPPPPPKRAAVPQVVVLDRRGRSRRPHRRWHWSWRSACSRDRPCSITTTTPRSNRKAHHAPTSLRLPWRDAQRRFTLRALPLSLWSLLCGLSALCAGLLACSYDQTLIVVELSAVPPMQVLHVQAQLDGKAATQPIDLPPDALRFGVRIPKDRRGLLQITIEARDDKSCVLARGSGELSVEGGMEYALSIPLAPASRPV